MIIKDMLKEELKEEIGELGKMTLGDDEYVKTVGGVTQLTDRLIKLEELEIEANKVAIEEQKVAIEEQKIDEDREDRKVKNRITVASFGVPALITAGGMVAMFILEGKGVIFPTQGERNIISRIFRGK